jgi:Protein of unknown function (DUF4231)
MDKAVFDDYVKSRYYDQMRYYDDSAIKNQKRYKQFQWILIILSAVAPVLAALIGKFPHLQISVVIVSAVVAILTTGLKTFNYQELWVTYRATYEKLKPELFYHDFAAGPYAATDIDRESLFVTRVEAILDAEHTQWPPAKKLQEDQAREQEPDAAQPHAGQPEANDQGVDKPDPAQPETPQPEVVEPDAGADEPQAAPPNAAGAGDSPEPAGADDAVG